MQIHWKNCLAALWVLGATTMLMPTEAIAQSNSGNRNVRSIPDAFESSFYGFRGRYGFRTSIFGELVQRFFLYPDNSIVGDSNRVADTYREVMDIQTMSDPFIRTPDLDNPFNRSLLTDPPTR